MHVVYSMFSWMLYSLTFGQDTPVSQQCANPPNLLFFLDWRYSLEGMEDYVGVFNIRHILPALFRAFYEIIYINCDLLFYPLHYTSVRCYEITYVFWRPFYRRSIGRFMWPEQCTLYGECATSSQTKPSHRPWTAMQLLFLQQDSTTGSFGWSCLISSHQNSPTWTGLSWTIVLAALFASAPAYYYACAEQG